MNTQSTNALFNEAIKCFQVFLKPPNSSRDLDRAISYARQSVLATSEDDPNLAMRAYSVGEMLQYRYNNQEEPEDLIDALRFAEMAYACMNEDCEVLPSCMWMLGVLYDSQYQTTGDARHLDVALEKIQSAIRRAPDDLEYQQACGMILIHRYEHFGSDEISRLGKALQYANGILSSQSHHLWANSFHQRSLIYSFLHEEAPRVGFMSSALADARSFVSLTDFGHSDDSERSRSLQALAYVLQKSFEHEGNPEHLDEAISSIEEAVQLLKNGDGLLRKCQNHLALGYENRFELRSDQKDLERAISFSEKALNGVSSTASQKLRWTVNLANQLGRYSGLTGRKEYLDEAIRRLQDIPDSETLRPFDRIEAKSDLALLMIARARHGNIAGLSEASHLLEDCFKSVSKYHIDHLRHLIRYIDASRARYELTTTEAPSSKEAEKADEALSMIPQSHRQRAEWLEALARFWSARFEWSHAPEDLEKSLSILMNSVESSLQDHPSRYHRKFMLANIEWERYLLAERSGDTEKAWQSYEQVVQNCVEAAESPHSFCWTRVMSARTAMKMFWETSDWDRAMAIGTAAIKLLPVLCSRYQSPGEQQNHISLVYGLASETCSACIKAGKWEDGLRYLEFGRGLVIGYTIDTRSDLALLQKDQPDLANEYEMLRMKLLRSHEVMLSNVPEVILREGRELFNKTEDCLERIRKITGYETFLDIPNIKELQVCATEGPIVVVNHTVLSSDAILVLPTRTITLPLSEMQEKFDTHLSPDRAWGFGSLNLRDKRSRAIAYCSDSDSDEETDKGSMLQWLWRTCVKPILDELTKVGALSAEHDKQRTWWIGSGNAASYPFHAAASGHCKPCDEALRRTIPSYVPSIKSLSYARQLSKNAIDNLNKGKPRLLLVTMSTTPGKRPLPGAERESLVIQKNCDNAYTIGTLDNPTSDRVMELLNQNNLVHFACHGVSHPEDPSKSHLLMQRGQELDPLEVSRMATLEKSKVGWIAYLSACSTVEIKNKALAEEGIHMSSALLLAGFPHVIGSLWQVDDNVSVHMARNFYEGLSEASDGIYKGQNVAEAWRDAVVRTREELQLKPEEWSVYVHSGS